MAFSTVIARAFFTVAATGLVLAGGTTAAGAAAPQPGDGITLGVSYQVLSGPGVDAHQLFVPADFESHRQLTFDFPAGHAYSDLKATADNPLVKGDCNERLALFQGTKEAGSGFCSMRLPEVQNNESRTYTVTLSGKEDGVAFTKTESFTDKGVVLTRRMAVDGDDITARSYLAKAGKPLTVTETFTNGSASTLPPMKLWGESGLYASKDCTIPALTPGQTASCTYTLQTVPVAGHEQEVGWYPIDLWEGGEMNGQAGGWSVVSNGLPGTQIMVKRDSEPGGGSPSSTPSTSQPTATETTSTTGSSTTEPTATESTDGEGTTSTAPSTTRTAAPVVTPVTGSSTTPDTGAVVTPSPATTAQPPLAQTGVPVTAIIAGAGVLVAAGAGALAMARRRRA